VNKRGESWAIVTIEDLDAAMEVLFFPKSYIEMGADLVPDSAVAVRGRVNWRDERLSVFASGLVPLDIADAQAGLVAPLVLKADALRINPATVSELKSALVAHAGDNPVTLVLCYGQRETPLAIDGFSVTVTSALLGELKSIPGIAVASAAAS
jgi:DNA polymerase-3 subunit alpha